VKLVESEKQRVDSTFKNSSGKELDKLSNHVISLKKDRVLLEMALSNERSNNAQLSSQMADLIQEKAEMKDMV